MLPFTFLNQLTMTKKYLVALLPIVLSVTSCKKDDDESVETVPVTENIDYTPYATGNYWVYERYRIDTGGVETPLGIYDSCYVSGDTVVNGNQYFILVKPDYLNGSNENYILRDSLHYLIDLAGEIQFSSVDFTTVFNSYYITAGVADTVAAIQIKMENKDVSYTVPALTSITSDMVKRYNFYPAWSINGNVRMMHTRYGRNVGVVSETLPFFHIEPFYTERKLVRYHLN